MDLKASLILTMLLRDNKGVEKMKAIIVGAKVPWGRGKHLTLLSISLSNSFYDPLDCSLPGNGLPFPSPGNLPNPGIKPVSPALAGGFFTIGKSPGKSSSRLCLHRTPVDSGILKRVLGLVSDP